MKNRKFWVSLIAGALALLMLLSLLSGLIPRANAASVSEADHEIVQMQ